jgi:hypothetical protein
VRSERGRIRVLRQREAGAQWFDVGPGLPLGASAEGRFIAALRAKQNAAQHEAPYELVVYHVPRR